MRSLVSGAMRLVLFAVLISTLSSCATSTPTYSFHTYALGSNQMDQAQANAICVPRAQLAAQQVASSSGGSPQQICIPGQFNYQGCLVSNSANSLGGSLIARGNGQAAGDATYASCMAEYGWGVQKVCVSGC